VKTDLYFHFSLHSVQIFENKVGGIVIISKAENIFRNQIDP